MLKNREEEHKEDEAGRIVLQVKHCTDVTPHMISCVDSDPYGSRSIVKVRRDREIDERAVEESKETQCT